MAEFLELRLRGEARFAPLAGQRVTVGREPGTDITLDSDLEVSRVHAIIERIGARWFVGDASSSNGTFVNGERLVSFRALQTGDEIRIGQWRLTFRSLQAEAVHVATAISQDGPAVTNRERDVLIALFGRAVPGDALLEPASTKEMAKALGVTEAAVKQHLLKLYDKFALIGAAERNRGRLANEALRRGVITLAELKIAARR